ncbi:MAG: hypothetical protein N3F05_04445 [Candidatus Diapherotrites archaeon]|nr:hypothetical protein [Candidatus Diapherotrites archaeon]
MMRMNSKGQAFSTFQLLISAIIALAILVILLSVLGIIPNLFNISQNPVDAMVDKIKDARNKPAVPVQGGKVNFTKDNRTVTTESIASVSGVGLEKEQICLSPGQFMGQAEIISKGQDGSKEKQWTVVEDGSRITYNKDNVQTTFTVICHSSATRLKTYIEEDLPEIKVEWMDSGSFKCKCLDNEQFKEQPCCLIVLKYSS